MSSSSSSSPLLPSHLQDEHQSRVVRFDSECVLIPEQSHRSRRPHMITKSYALPLWKKKPHPPTLDPETTEENPDREEVQVVFKVPLPSFKASKSRSPTRAHDTDPLPPCLVHRESSAPPHPYHHPRSVRRPSLTLPPQNIVTVPLRACCLDCIHTTEECLKEGELWEEKFSRGARRRRAASLDATSPSCSHDDPSALCSALTAEGNHLGRAFPLAITVDEVEQKRKSTEFLDGIPHEILSSSLDDYNGHDRGSSSSSAASYFSDEVKPSSQKAPPIVEEDEDQLFPLPSPRRSPSNSPKPSPSQSPSISPIPSPNASTASLRPSLLSGSESPSRDSLSGSASDESVGNTRQNWRRTNRYEKGLLTPEASPNPAISHSSPLQHKAHQPSALPTPSSSPLHTFSVPFSRSASTNNTTTVTTIDDQEVVSFPTQASPRLALSLTRTSSTFAVSPPERVNHIRAVSSPTLPSTPKYPASPPQSPVLSRRTPASPTSPPTSPRTQSRKPRTSFSLLKVGADVLKGVGSIAGGA